MLTVATLEVFVSDNWMFTPVSEVSQQKAFKVFKGGFC